MCFAINDIIWPIIVLCNTSRHRIERKLKGRIFYLSHWSIYLIFNHNAPQLLLEYCASFKAYTIGHQIYLITSHENYPLRVSKIHTNHVRISNGNLYFKYIYVSDKVLFKIKTSLYATVFSLIWRLILWICVCLGGSNDSLLQSTMPSENARNWAKCCWCGGWWCGAGGVNPF